MQAHDQNSTLSLTGMLQWDDQPHLSLSLSLSRPLSSEVIVNHIFSLANYRISLKIPTIHNLEYRTKHSYYHILHECDVIISNEIILFIVKLQ